MGKARQLSMFNHNPTKARHTQQQSWANHQMAREKLDQITGLVSWMFFLAYWWYPFGDQKVENVGTDSSNKKNVFFMSSVDHFWITHVVWLCLVKTLGRSSGLSISHCYSPSLEHCTSQRFCRDTPCRRGSNLSCLKGMMLPLEIWLRIQT